jgi:hypothetical protein
MFKTLMTASLAIATIAGASMATTSTAEAGDGGAFFAGAVGGLLVGSAIAANHGYGHGYYAAPVTYYEEPTCFWAKKKVHTSYGWKVKKIWVCE